METTKTLYQKQQHNSYTNQRVKGTNTTAGLEKGINSAVGSITNEVKTYIELNEEAYRVQLQQDIKTNADVLLKKARDGKMSQKDYQEQMESFKKTLNEKVIDGNLKNAINSTINSAVYEGNLDIKDAEYERSRIQQDNTYSLNNQRYAQLYKEMTLETDPNLKAEKQKELNSIKNYNEKYLNSTYFSARGTNSPRFSGQQKINMVNKQVELNREAEINTGIYVVSKDLILLENVDRIATLNGKDALKELQNDENLKRLIVYDNVYDKNGKVTEVPNEVNTLQNLKDIQKKKQQIYNDEFGAGELAKQQLAEKQMSNISSETKLDYAKNESQTLFADGFNKNVLQAKNIKTLQDSLEKISLSEISYANQFSNNMTAQDLIDKQRTFRQNKTQVVNDFVSQLKPGQDKTLINLLNQPQYKNPDGSYTDKAFDFIKKYKIGG